jgi:hypothetical protein
MSPIESIFLIQAIVSGIIRENITCVVFIIVESIPIFYMVKAVSEILFKKIVQKYNRVLDRCIADPEYKNDIASYLYFFKDLGPSTSAFTIVTLITDAGYNKLTVVTIVILTIVFIVGIIIKAKSRRLIKKFYKEIAKRSS